ncbi:MAG: agmatinase family protein [Myxococcales bacterium]|nr:agmatinase family protein [Myxococcales bacterium]
MAFNPDAPGNPEQIFGLPFTPENARVVLLPVPWQATTSFRRGTRDGPRAIREASLQVDLHDLEVGEAWREGYAMLLESDLVRLWDEAAEGDALAVIAAGGDEAGDLVTVAALGRVNALSGQVNDYVHAEVSRLLDAGRLPGVVGGDHSVPFGAILAAAERYPGLGILHIDAHADLREAYEGFVWSHASILHNVLTRIEGIGAVAQVGLRDVGSAEAAFAAADARVFWFTDPQIQRALAEGTPWLSLVREIVAVLPKKIWITLDIDGLEPALCPGTGTPVPGGLTWGQTCVLLAEVAAHCTIVGFDLNEVGPGEWDGNVGARLLYKLCGHAVRS